MLKKVMKEKRFTNSSNLIKQSKHLANINFLHKFMRLVVINSNSNNSNNTLNF